MSNIIKSSRVIESDIRSKQNSSTENPLEEKVIEEAWEKYKEIISDAKKEFGRIMEHAHISSEQKISDAHNRVQEIFREAKSRGYDEGHKIGLKKGYDAGYAKGYEQGKDESEQLILEALDIKNDYINKRNDLIKDVEEEVIELVISIYEKVIHKKVEEDEKLIISLVLNGIDNLEIARELTIVVPKESYEIVENHREIILAKASSVNKLDIRINSDMKEGDCVIETSQGNVDVSINNQLEEVKDLLTTILSNE